MGRTSALLVLFVVAQLARAEEPKKLAPAATLEVRLTDGSRVNVAILDETIPIQTSHGKLIVPATDVRRIELTVLRVHVPQFGDKTLKVTDLVSVRGAGTVVAEEKVTAQPDPGNLTNFAQQTGKSFYFTVTGNATGSIYGSDLYTTDSTL